MEVPFRQTGPPPGRDARPADVRSPRSRQRQACAAHLKERLPRGADELDLARSGLDDTMRQAYNQIRQIMLSREDVPDLRTAALSSP